MADFGYVKNYGLDFAWDLDLRKKTTLIVLHHSEGGDSETVKSIHNYHRSLVHAGIDYNICVERNGGIAWGRGLEAVGGHTMNKWYLPTYGVNARSVGICALGNFNKAEMPEAQKQALKRITADVVRHYSISSVSQIVTHKGIAGASYTDCPGRYFPYEEIIQYILNGGSDKTPVPYTFRVTKLLKKYMNDAEVIGVSVALTNGGYTDRGATSVFDDDMERIVKNFQFVNGLKPDGKVGRDTTRSLGGVYGK